MTVRCKCKLSPKKQPLKCKPQYKKVCKGSKCGCFHKCDLRSIMRRCDCDEESQKREVSDPGASLIQFCDMTRQDFCQRQCRPCSDLECKYANTPMKRGKSNIGIFIAAQFRQEHCRKSGCSKDEDDGDEDEDEDED